MPPRPSSPGAPSLCPPHRAPTVPSCRPGRFPTRGASEVLPDGAVLSASLRALTVPGGASDTDPAPPLSLPGPSHFPCPPQTGVPGGGMLGASDTPQDPPFPGGDLRLPAAQTDAAGESPRKWALEVGPCRLRTLLSWGGSDGYISAGLPAEDGDGPQRPESQPPGQRAWSREGTCSSREARQRGGRR